MQVTIGWIQLAAAVGAAQGLLLAVVLFVHRDKRTANRLLAALMLAFTTFLLGEVYYSIGWVRAYPHFFGISHPMPWVFGPLVYLYTLAASDVSWRLRARDALHFAPAIVVVIVTLPFYMMSGPAKAALFDRITVGDVPAVLVILSPSKFVSGIVYSVLTIRYLARHRRRIENSYSNTDRVNLRWLVWLAGAAAGIWLLAVAVNLSNIVPENVQGPGDDLVALAIALLVYSIGYMGLRQPKIHRYDDPEEPLPIENAPPAATLQPESPQPARVQSASETDARYRRSGLSDAEAAALEAELKALMTTEHPYRDPDLTLPDLAGRLGTTPHKLSEVLNAELSQTFYEFVNGYRVDDVRRRIADGKSNHLKVLALAMDAGFSSKSTFNEVFKKQTGQTPSMYRKALAG